MTDTPLIRYSISDPSHLVNPASGEWLTPLPLSIGSEGQSWHPPKVCDYFIAAESHLRENEFEVIRAGALHTIFESIIPQDIEGVNICLVKHGRFYHPSKVIVRLKTNQSFSMALNIAFSHEGNACVDREYQALIALNSRIEFIPKVFGKKTYAMKDGLIYSMFSAQWFENYHEFHLSLDNDGVQKIIVWDSEKGNYYLSKEHSFKLYRKIAFIMTCCYDPYTGDQIHPWHHAAGDFIIKNDDIDVDVRLITVRQYASLFKEMPDDIDSLAEAATIFLIGLSLRTRIDRADGVGDTLWADDFAVQATVQGFIDGLCSSNFTSHHGSALKKKIIALLSQLNSEDIFDYSRLIIESYNPLSPDIPVIKKNIENHVRKLHQAFEKFLC
ncbi:MAG: hypothetical protein WC799_13050 [Desulfobacteraceae bacterium]|jgi:hypothetical protein